MTTQRLVLNVAHRGASGDFPENTLAAIRGAIALGADSIELDVRRSRDGELVLLHDPTLTRTTDVRSVFPHRAPWAVEHFDYAELRRLDAGGWKSPVFAGEPIPTLREAVDLVRGSGAGLLLELKSPERYPGIVGDLASELLGARDLLGRAPDHPRLVVESFDFTAMAALKARSPQVPVGLLGTPARGSLPAVGAWADQVNPHHWSVDRAYVEEVHRHGMGCLVWTVNRTTAIRRALALGVDGIITDQPERLSAALLRRGARRHQPARRWFPVPSHPAASTGP